MKSARKKPKLVSLMLLKCAVFPLETHPCPVSTPNLKRLTKVRASGT